MESNATTQLMVVTVSEPIELLGPGRSSIESKNKGKTRSSEISEWIQVEDLAQLLRDPSWYSE